MIYLKSFIAFVMVSIFMEASAHKIDVEIRKRSTNANYPFNPNYSPEQIIDEYILCLQKNSEALQLQIKLSNKYGCSGSLKDKILCGIRNRDNFDVSDYDLLLKIYNLLPECAKKLSSDKSTLTGHSFIKNAYDSLGQAYRI